MSGIVAAGAPSDYGLMGILITNSAAVKQKLDQLTTQASNGLVGSTYAGLGSGASVSLNLRPQIANLQAWQNNADAATGQMAVAQTALTQIQSIAANFYAQLNNVQSVNSSEVDTIAASARDALSQVAGLLDTQDAGVYVFAGQDTGNAPVPDPDHILTSNFYTQINAAVGSLDPNVNNAATVAQTTFDAAKFGGTASPFSTYLTNTQSPSLPTIQVGQNQTETTGISASANGLIPVSQSVGQTIPGGPPSTTGSYMRDVLRALATIGSLSTGQANDPGFQSLVQDTRISLSNAVNTLGQDAGVLGNVQSSLTATQARLADTLTALTGQVSSAEDVDMAATLSQLSLVQTQMQASYQLIATLNALSLAKFLPVGA